MQLAHGERGHPRRGGRIGGDVGAVDDEGPRELGVPLPIPCHGQGAGGLGLADFVVEQPELREDELEGRGAVRRQADPAVPTDDAAVVVCPLHLPHDDFIRVELGCDGEVLEQQTRGRIAELAAGEGRVPRGAEVRERAAQRALRGDGAG